MHRSGCVLQCGVLHERACSRNDQVLLGLIDYAGLCAICGGRFECRSIKEYVERQGICWGCCFENKIKIAAETLYQLVCAIPQTERDREEIYPADFRYPRVPPWPEEEMRWPGLGLRDYSQTKKLLFKYGRYETVIHSRGSAYCL